MQRLMLIQNVTSKEIMNHSLADVYASLFMIYENMVSLNTALDVDYTVWENIVVHDFTITLNTVDEGCMNA